MPKAVHMQYANINYNTANVGRVQLLTLSTRTLKGISSLDLYTYRSLELQYP